MIAEAEYEFIRKLVYDRSRINLGPDKMELVCSRLRRRARALEITSLKSYISLLRSAAGAQEMTGLLDVISTNVTDFFREPDHFRFVRDTLLPEWQAAKGRCPTDCFRAWSAACSSGEEPYSLAIVLAEFFDGAGAADWRVMASDISSSMLKRAQEAIYPEERIRLPDPALLRRHFQKGVGRYDGNYRIKSALRSHVSFQHLNLFDPSHQFPQKFDLIFCRNVMIYFDRNTQEQLVPRLVDQLGPGGYLFVGHSESLIGIDHSLKSVRPSIYRRISAG
ncbi:MAG TPA: protein-glutamate O-methyltransferase CheR [Verrucomicrobiae bacterium]|nr:protein-glutamate O-methyltransferase CheR [Verrucomicrobiae bacterium]